MKVTLPRKSLHEAVGIVGRAVSGRNPLPILSHILISADTDGIRLVGTDLELGITCTIPDSAWVLEPGSLTCPTKTLSEVLANLPGGDDVTLSVKKDVVHVQGAGSKSDFKINGLPAEEFPQLPVNETGTIITVAQSTLKEMIRQVGFATSKDDARAILTGILLTYEGGRLRLIATDTHRLAVRELCLPDDLVDPIKAIIPSRAISELSNLLTAAEGDVQISFGYNQVTFLLPGDRGIQVQTRLIEGQYPNFERVIPKDHNRKLTMNTDELRQAVKRAMIVARENASRIVFSTTERENLLLSAQSSTVGNAQEQVSVVTEGEPVEMGFNGKYLLDLLAVVDTESVQFELTDALRPALVRPVALNGPDMSYLCVVMPMAIG